MKMDPGIDTGPILSQQTHSIHPEDTAWTLSNNLAQLGAELLLATLPAYLAGKIQPVEQDESQANYAPMLKKEDGELDFHQPARDLALRVRAFNPWPGAFTTWRAQILKINRAHSASNQPDNPKEPGKPIIHEGCPAFTTTDGILVLDEVQPAGKKPMIGDVFLRGARDWASSGQTV
jgi:methionyl-tRNA formyltransferase